MDLQFPSFNLIFRMHFFPSLLLLYYYCPPPGRDGSLLKAVDIRGANLFALQEAKFYYNDLHSFQWQHQQHVLQTCTMVHTTTYCCCCNTVNVIVLYYYYYGSIYLDSRLNHVLTLLLLASGATQLLLVKIEGWLLCSIQLVLLLQSTRMHSITTSFPLWTIPFLICLPIVQLQRNGVNNNSTTLLERRNPKPITTILLL